MRLRITERVITKTAWQSVEFVRKCNEGHLQSQGLALANDAGKLLSIIIPRTSLPQFFKQPLIHIATIRNQLGSSHGAGTQPRNVPKHVAQYTINVTASAILLLVEEARPINEGAVGQRLESPITAT